MITATPLARQPPLWQQELAAGFARPAELLAALGLDAHDLRRAGLEVDLAAGVGAGTDFALRVPRAFVARMRSGDPHDPLLRQVLPLLAERNEVTGFGPDPLAESTATAAPGLLQKYAGRALLITTGACAVHCRYCFRREFPYGEHVAAGPRWDDAFDAIASDASIREVILSGGDPLSLSDSRLAQICARLTRIPHVQALRVHTRLPIVLPSRIDAGLCDVLESWHGTLTVVVHSNHPRELDAEVARALRDLRTTGAVLLNQAVLLAGVNDSVEALEGLSLAMHRHGVLPYYLHLLDPVRGSAHFDVSETRGRELIDTLARRLPGFLVPRLAREEPGRPAKTVLAAGLDPT